MKKKVNFNSKIFTFPRLPTYEQFGIKKRLMARIDRGNINNKIFLGYCNVHKTYYLDRNHTHGTIRCPLCDKEWLTENDFYSLSQSTN